MRGLGLALLLCALFPRPALAVFTAAQMERIDHEPLLDAEYFADIASFAEPLAWQEERRLSTAPFYRINAASLDCCDLYLDQEARLSRKLTKDLTVRFRFTQLEDKEKRELHHWLELEQGVGAGFSAILFGEPTFRKEDADIGLGAAWTGEVAEGRRLRVSARRTFVDFNFNQRGSTSQTYAEKPLTDEAALAFQTPDHVVEAGIEADHPLRRLAPADKRTFSYRRTTATLGWRGRFGGTLAAVEYAYEAQKKGDLFEPDPLAASADNSRRTHRLLAALTALSGKDAFEAGHRLLLRRARTDLAHDPQGGVFYGRWESQPYLRWRRDLSARLTSELAGFLSLGENRKRYAARPDPSAYQTLVEAKVGAGMDFKFGPAGRIGVYGTFDADSPGHFWDGGNVRAMFFF